MSNKALTRLWLIFVAAYPLCEASICLLDFLVWLLDWDIDMSFRLQTGGYALAFLPIAFIISLRERFCVFHRICIVTIFLINTNHFWALRINPELANYLTMAIFVAMLVGIIGSVWHFILQITDFIRYVRIEERKPIG